jgi:hypothetical protein
VPYPGPVVIDLYGAGSAVAIYSDSKKDKMIEQAFYAVHHSPFFTVGTLILMVVTLIMGIRRERRRSLSDHDEKILIK